MSIELRHLRYFIAVAEELNITRAAERLHTAQPSLGRQIKWLESEVGADLLRRQGHKFVLTDAGRVLLERARTVLRELDAMYEHVRHAANLESGKLTIGFIPGTEWRVFPRLAPFLQASRTGVQVVLRSLTVPEQIAALQAHAIDVGFLRGPVSDPEITCEVVLSDEIVAIVPALHPFAKLERISISDLATMPLVYLKKSIASELHDTAISLAEEAGVEFSSKVETENILTTLCAVGVGLGCSLVPKYLEQMLPETAVSRALKHTPAPTVNLVLAYRNQERLPVLDLFLGLVRECFKAEQAQERLPKGKAI